MAKKVKTRKQKILADLRRVSVSSTEKKVDTTVYSLPKINTATNSIPSIKIKTSTQTTVATSSYNYLSKDLLKTIFLTGAIVIVELVIRFTVKGI
ncbi:MAG TPA: hypothetical protein VLG67_02155 [Candidatus Saccharimonadales bacterium]|nr:hypothetical protein [Candidatus Saccharimonadales bacterium]